MGFVFISLIAGVTIGWLRPPGASGLKITRRLTMAGLFLLLTAMGAQLGANEKILADLDRLGLQAAVLASLAVLGSIVAVYTAFRWLDREK